MCICVCACDVLGAEVRSVVTKFPKIIVYNKAFIKVIEECFCVCFELFSLCLQCFDAVGWAAGRASGL